MWLDVNNEDMEIYGVDKGIVIGRELWRKNIRIALLVWDKGEKIEKEEEYLGPTYYLWHANVFAE